MAKMCTKIYYVYMTTSLRLLATEIQKISRILSLSYLSLAISFIPFVFLKKMKKKSCLLWENESIQVYLMNMQSHRFLLIDAMDFIARTDADGNLEMSITVGMIPIA